MNKITLFGKNETRKVGTECCITVQSIISWSCAFCNEEAQQSVWQLLITQLFGKQKTFNIIMQI